MLSALTIIIVVKNLHHINFMVTEAFRIPSLKEEEFFSVQPKTTKETMMQTLKENIENIVIFWKI